MVSSSAALLGTHNGKFHTDEVFACYMLKTLPNYKNHVVVRTRDPAILETCDVVLDVGGIYDHENKRYDHHQCGFTETMNSLLGIDFHTKLSSAGLVYAHYGKEVIANLLKVDAKNPVVELIFQRLYKNFVESVDAIDNGIQQFDGKPRSNSEEISLEVTSTKQLSKIFIQQNNLPQHQQHFAIFQAISQYL